VKVAGPTDKACQVEARLHELSADRDRLKDEQTKLEHLAAGLMIDLQSSLLASESDQIAVPAPRGSLRHSDSDSSLSLLGLRLPLDAASPSVIADDSDVSSRSRTKNVSRYSASSDDIDVSNRSRTGLLPSPSGEGGAGPSRTSDRAAHPAIRATQSFSPGRTSAHAPPAASPSPHGPLPGPARGAWAGAATAARVNFRTGMSGHAALTSSRLLRPHEGGLAARPGAGGRRTMGHHAGISKAGSFATTSSLWESPCAGGA